MFQAHQVLFMYCVSPVHLGAGTAIGLIDNPIQRERHTDYPMFAGSGIKGAIRHHFWSQLDGETRNSKEHWINRIFGPETDSSDYAGAISFGDAQLVAFPVRSLKRAYIYLTSPTALARTYRLLTLTDTKTDWSTSDVGEPEIDHCKLCNPDLLTGDKLHLEAFEFTTHIDKPLMKVSEWLANNALPVGGAYPFFREKLKTDLVLVRDEDFGYFVRHATVVEPHVRIDNNKGTAQEGGLFYTENLPPESLLIAPIMASAERTTDEKIKGESRWDAKKVLEHVVYGKELNHKGLDGQLIQMGGDATTGRGQVIIRAVGGNNHGQ